MTIIVFFCGQKKKTFKETQYAIDVFENRANVG